MVRNAIAAFGLVLVIALAVCGWLAHPLEATEHVVSTADLHRQIRSAQTERQVEQQKITGFFQSERSREILSHAKVDPARIDTAVSFLSDEEVARLASQVQHIEHDVAAGALSNEHLTYIVIALAAAVIVLIAK